jgi:hypothetical protein
MPHDEYHGDTIAEPDHHNYPTEWTAEQRLTAYWFALGHNITASSTHAWHGILNAAQRDSERRHTKIRKLITITPDEDEIPEDES